MWVKSNVTIPRMIDESAVGFYADEIYIFGGIGYAQQIIRYNFTRNEFIDDGTELLSVGTRGIAQFYDQSGDTMYFSRGDTFSIYDFSTKQFTDNWNNITTPVTVGGYYSCLSSTDEYLFVIGGKNNGNVINTVQTLHLLSTNWTLSYMNTARHSSSCEIDRDRSTLYVIAGVITNHEVYVDSIEMLNITDIETQSWVMLDETLTDHGLQGTRALLHQKSNRIFVIGGYDRVGDDIATFTNSVHIINTVTNQVTLSPDPLPYKVTTTAALIVDNILYSFGGCVAGNN
eukprot:848385_1